MITGRDPGDETDAREPRKVEVVAAERRPFADPDCPCTRDAVRLNTDGTCPICGYDW